MAHVQDAERAYVRKIGLRPAADAPIDEVRAEVIETFRLGTDGSPLPGGTWPLRYAARRFAWHVLDHAWEIEDRDQPSPSRVSVAVRHLGLQLPSLRVGHGVGRTPGSTSPALNVPVAGS